jgi:hypothetical protein
VNAPPCEEVTELLAVAIDGALPSRLEAHLETCERCMELLREATQLGDAIKDAADDYRHAPDFAERVLAALDPDGVEPTRRMRRFSTLPHPGQT